MALVLFIGILSLLVMTIKHFYFKAISEDLEREDEKTSYLKDRYEKLKGITMDDGGVVEDIGIYRPAKKDGEWSVRKEIVYKNFIGSTTDTKFKILFQMTDERFGVLLNNKLEKEDEKFTFLEEKYNNMIGTYSEDGGVVDSIVVARPVEKADDWKVFSEVIYKNLLGNIKDSKMKVIFQTSDDSLQEILITNQA